MLETTIPYVPISELTLVDLPVIGDLKLRPFGPLAVAGVLLGRYQAIRYARRRDMDLVLFRDYFVWMALAAFVLSHWVSIFFYYPEKLEQGPLILLQLFNGMSSVGGFLGAFVGGVIYLRVYCARRPVGAQPVTIYADASTFGSLTGWCFARAACSMVHDHPGKVVPEGTFLAVGPWPDGQWRYDLGLIEMLFVIGLMLLVYFVLRWDQWAPGRLTGLVLTVYAPFRFFTDSLRSIDPVGGVLAIPDERYLGLTPAQWCTIAFLLLGLWLLRVRKPKDDDLRWAKDSDRLAREAQSEAAPQPRTE